MRSYLASFVSQKSRQDGVQVVLGFSKGKDSGVWIKIPAIDDDHIPDPVWVR